MPSVPKCPVCFSEGKHVNAELYRCEVCDNIFEFPAIVTAEYNSTYVQQRYGSYPTTEIMSYLRLGVLKSFVPCGGSLLDVGYGNGSFLKAAKAAGFDCWGSDVHGVDYGIRDIPLDVAAKRRWTVTSFLDSVEHFSELTLVKELAANSDVILCSVPWRPPEFPATLRWKHHRKGEHLFYPSIRTLRTLFNKTPIFTSDVEDAIRGKRDGAGNIMTVVLR